MGLCANSAPDRSPMISAWPIVRALHGHYVSSRVSRTIREARNFGAHMALERPANKGSRQ